MEFHDALEQAIRGRAPGIKVGTLAGLHERGSLDLEVRDADGLTLMERMIKSEPLVPEIIDFLDGIGRSDVYAEPRNGRWALMDRQLWFMVKNQHVPDDVAMAKMINRVNPQWWQQLDHANGDEGSTLVAALAPLSNAANPLSAIWQRGIDPHARLGNDERLLAAQYMTRMETLEAYISAGGDFNTPAMVVEGKDYAMWRDILKRNDSLKDAFRSINERKLINSDEFRLDYYLKEAHMQRGNRSEMMKIIITRADWHEAIAYNRDPAWMTLVRSRVDLIAEFMERKRKRPNFAQRDHTGKSLWHVASISSMGMSPDMFKLLEKEIPSRDHMKSSDGEGLVVQVLETAEHRKKLTSVKGVLELLGKVEDDEYLLAGLENFDFTRIYKRAETVENGPLPLLEILNRPELHPRLTPVQRGHIMGALVLGDKKLDYQSGQCWVTLLKTTHIVQDLFALGVHWPDVEHERLKQRAEDSSHDFKSVNGRPLLAEWVSCLERQKLDASTAKVQPDTGRRMRL